MKQLLIIFGVLFCIIFVCNGQRVAPGVPPQHYNPPMNQMPQQQYQTDQHHQQQQQVYQQQQHQQMPQHQVPIQQQQHQVPVQQQQQPQQHQVPIQQQQAHHQPHGGHGSHGHQQGVLNSNMEHEKQHIAEHMDVPIDTSKMSEQELQFHYFKMHDADNNNRLDGCELIKSLIHWHDKNENKDEEGNEKAHETTYEGKTDTSLQGLIDPIMLSMDFNNDGYITYAEYKSAVEAPNLNKD